MGFASNKYVKNALILFHANCGDLGIASELFDDSAKAHKVAWSSLTSGYVKRGKIDEAIRLFDEMPEKDQNLEASETGKRIHLYILETASVSSSMYVDTPIWNALIDMYAKCGSIDSAIEVFRGMKERDLSSWSTLILG